MRILWLTPYLPRPVFGAGTRVYNLIKVLASTCEIDLIAHAWPPSPDDELGNQLRALCRTVQCVPPTVQSRRDRREMQLKALHSRRSSQYWMSFAPAMQECIDRAVRENDYDVAVLEHSFMGYYTLPESLLVVLDQHNVESDILRRAGRHERSFVRRVYNLVEFVRYYPDERRICRSVDLILAASEHDRESMRHWGAIPPCVVVPNGVDCTYFGPHAVDGSEEAMDIVFTGAMHYAPNAAAMLYFVDEIWPLIRARAPGAMLRIVGGDPAPEVLRLAQLPNVSVRGNVADMRPYLANAAVVVVPLRVGGGTRLKIVEALAMARAVVTTSVGCEGLMVQDGKQLFVADEPIAFAARVVELLHDPARRAQLGENGRRLVKESYDWPVVGAGMETVLRQLVSHRGNTGGV